MSWEKGNARNRGGEALDCGDSSPLSPAGLVPRRIAAGGLFAAAELRKLTAKSDEGDKSPSPKRGQVPRSPRAAAFAAIGLLAVGTGFAWLALNALQKRQTSGPAGSPLANFLQVSHQPEAASPQPGVLEATDARQANASVPPLPHQMLQSPQPAIMPAAAEESVPEATAPAFESNRQRFLKNASRLAAAQNSSHAPSRQPIDPGTPGATLTSGTEVIMVEASQTLPGYAAPALEIAINSSQATANSPAAEIGPISPIGPILQPTTEAASVPTSSTAPAQTRTGFTHEEELFRARWGWTAYGDVQRAAFETAHQSE